MKKASIQEVLDLIVKQDPRYGRDAYLFLREALDYTLKMLKREGEENSGRGDKSAELKRPPSHVSGQELLEGIRNFALQEYGPLAKTVLEHWGVTRCEDFGEIVFNMVDHGILGKTDQDSKADFASLYSFEDAFLKPYRVAEKSPIPGDSTAGNADGRP